MIDMTKRLEFIDLTKIIAILLIVVSHMNILNLGVNTFVTSFYIVVFFVCSGYTFNKNKLDDKKYLINQIIKIIKYYFFYSIVLFVLFSILSLINHSFNLDNIVNNMIGIIYSRYSYSRSLDVILMGSGNAPLWFLTSYLITYILFYVSFSIINKRKYLLIIFLITGYLLSLFDILLPWSIDTSFYMCVFMFFGYYLKEKNIVSKVNIISILFMIILLVILNLYSLDINLSIKVYGLNYFYTFIMGIIGSLLLISVCYKLCYFKVFKESSVLGKYTIDIMAYHLMIIYVVKILIKNIYMSSIISLIIILLISKIINKVLKKIIKV